LRIDVNINELRVGEGKEKKGSPMKVHFILIEVARQMIKPQLLVGLLSFNSPLATR